MRALRSILLAVVLLAAAPAAAAAIVPAGFQESTVWTGFVQPDDDRVRRRRARVRGARSAARIVSTTRSPIRRRPWSRISRTPVHDFWDRGLLGMALDPEFTNGRPYVYVLYTYNKDPSDATFPRWPDNCPTPPGATADGCVVSGRLSRLDARRRRDAADHRLVPAVPEPLGRRPRVRPRAARSTSRPATAPRSTSPTTARTARRSTRAATRAARRRRPPTAEGGALRSQDVRTAGDPTGGDGAILRVDPDTGAALPDNPGAGSADPMTRRIVAHGFRNPFRLTLRPGTGEVWAGDVGWNEWEEIDRIAAPTAGVGNYGWPCYEGAGRMGSYDNLNLNLCETLYAQGAARRRDAALHVPPRRQGRRRARRARRAASVDRRARSSTPARASPPRYRDGLFFADYTRSCIWFMPAGRRRAARPGAAPDASPPARSAIVEPRSRGPDGDLYYPDLERRHGPADQLRLAERRADGARDRDAVERRRAARGPVRRHDVDRPERRRADVRLGPRRRRRLRRLDRRAPDPHATRAAGAVTVRLRVTDPGGLQGTDDA